MTKHSALNLINAYKETKPEGEKIPRHDRDSRAAITANISAPRKGNQ
jgi:hypothetical protein